MLIVKKLSKSFGIKPVLSEVDFQLKKGEKLGLIGLNGSGKTTLLEIITGRMKPDGGSVIFTQHDLRVGYLRQGLELPQDETITSYLCNLKEDVNTLSTQVERLAIELTRGPDNKEIIQVYDRTLARLQIACESTGEAEQVLAKLGLGDIPLDRPVHQLSGGQKTRLGLASVLITHPQLLVLDEPTNHLDTEMLEWLEGWLKRSLSAALIVSHDRFFLDKVVSGILELDNHTHSIRQFQGCYSDYVKIKREEQEKQLQEYANQWDEIRRLQRAAARMRDLARFHKGGKTDPGRADGFMVGFFANRGKETNQRAKNAEKRIHHLLTDEHIDKPAKTKKLKMEFENGTESGRDVVVMEGLSIGYGNSVLCCPLNKTIRFGERIVLIGANGSGKSTLLKTIVGLVPAQGGSVRLGSGVQYGFMAQEQEALDGNLTVLQIMLKEAHFSEMETRSFLSKYLFTGDEVFARIDTLSFGERARLSLACLVAQGCNLLLLDEPINHLDIPSRERFEEALSDFHGTILAVVHDRVFIKKFGQILWKFEDGMVVEYRTQV